MFSHRYRCVVWAVGALVGIWLVALAGHWFIEYRKLTAEKVRAYVESVDLAQLSAAARAQALKELADKLNALAYEERQHLRSERLLNDWFAKMTEAERLQFIEATMPTGFKQMIGAFEQMPEDKRRRLIDDALKNLRDPKNRPAANDTANRPPPISPELEAKIRTIGLNSFYSQSSAQTKAELAPLLEELQHGMESGRMLRRP